MPPIFAHAGRITWDELLLILLAAVVLAGLIIGLLSWRKFTPDLDDENGAAGDETDQGGHPT